MYEKTKENIQSLKSFLDGLDKDWCLTHIDAVPDNFLFSATLTVVSKYTPNGGAFISPLNANIIGKPKSNLLL